MTLSKAISNGSQDPYVLTAQRALLALGFSLPRFGADGVLGGETLAAYGAFLISRGLRAATDEHPKSITLPGAKALDAAVSGLAHVLPSANYVDERQKHPHAGRSTAMPFRTWAQTTAVVLHQTASKLGETPARWHSVPIHFGITRAGKIIQLYDLTEVCNHANGLNRPSVGIEIDGWFEGIEGKPETLWQPPGVSPPRKPMDLPAVQADAAKALVRWIVDTVAANGGAITRIHAHRQSSKDRRSDPGSLIWQTVGLWAKTQLGLSDGGPQFAVGNGRTIPEAWDVAYVGNLY